MNLKEELFDEVEKSNLNDEQIDTRSIDAGVKTVLNDLIKFQYDILNKYTSAISTLEDLGIEDYTEVLQSLLQETNDNIKTLESLEDIDDDDDQVSLEDLLEKTGADISSTNMATILLYIIENNYPEQYKQLKDGKYTSDQLLGILCDLGVKVKSDKSADQIMQEHIQKKYFRNDIKKIVERYVDGGDMISDILAESFIRNTKYQKINTVSETYKRRRKKKDNGISYRNNAGNVEKSVEFFNHIMGNQSPDGSVGEASCDACGGATSAGGDAGAAVGAM